MTRLDNLHAKFSRMMSPPPEYARLPNPAFLTLDRLEETVFVTSDHLAKLARAIVSDEVVRADVAGPELDAFLTAPTRKNFLPLLLAKWRHDSLLFRLAVIKGVNASLLPRSLFKPLWSKIGVDCSDKGGGAGELADDCLTAAMAKVAAPATRAEGMFLLWIAVAMIKARTVVDLVRGNPGWFGGDADFFLQIEKRGEDLQKRLGGFLHELDRLEDEEEDGNMDDDYADFVAELEADVRKFAPPKWFEANIAWCDTDYEVVAGFDATANPSERYGAREAARFLAANVNDHELTQAIVDRMAEARRAAGRTTSYLCQKLIDDVRLAAGKISPPGHLRDFVGGMADEDFAAIACLLSSPNVKNRALGRDALFGLLFQGYDEDEIFDIAVRFGDELGAVDSYIELRHEEARMEAVERFGRETGARARKAVETPEVYRAPRYALQARFDDGWLAKNVFLSPKNRERVAARLAAGPVGGLDGSGIGIQTASDFAGMLARHWMRHPFLKELRDEIAGQFAAGSDKRRDFTFFHDARSNFDRQWRAIQKSDPHQKPRIELIAEAIRIHDLFDADIAADAFLAYVMETDAEGLARARKLVDDFEDFADFIDAIPGLRDRAAETEARERAAREAEAAEPPSEDRGDETMMQTAAGPDANDTDPVAAWKDAIDGIMSDLKAAFALPDLALVDRIRARLPDLIGIAEDYRASALPLFDDVAGRLLPLLRDIAAAVPASEPNREIRDQLAGVIAAIEAVPADTQWPREAARQAEAAVEEISGLREQTVTAARRLDAVNKEVLAQQYANLQELPLLAQGILDKAARTYELSTALMASIPALAQPVPVLAERPDLKLVVAEQPAAEQPVEAPETLLEGPVAVPDFTTRPAEEVEPEKPGPDVSRANDEIRRLIAVRSLGMAYHVAAAVEACGGTAVVPSAILRLAAVAPHLDLPAMQVSGTTAETEAAMQEILSITQKGFPDGEAGLVQKLLTLAGAVGPAMLGRNATAIEILRPLAIAKAWNDAAFGLKEAVDAAARSRVIPTIEMYRTLRKNSDAGHEANLARGRIVKAVEHLRAREFKTYMIGTRVAKKLSEPDSEIGELLSAVEMRSGDAVKIAADFAASYRSVDAAVRLMDEANRSIPKHDGRPITGGVRNTIVAHIHEIAECCLGYVNAAQAASDTDSKRRHEQMALRDTLLDAIRKTEKATLDLKAAGQSATLAAAIDCALTALDRQRRVLDGDFDAPGKLDHLFAAHGSLAAVKGLVFGTSWKPIPYDGSDLLDVFLDDRNELADLIPGEVGSDRFFAIIRDRLAEGSFAAANLMVEMGKYLRISENDVETANAAIEEQVGPTREKTAKEVAEIKKSLAGVARYGNISERAEATTMAKELDRIRLDDLPRLTPAHARNENENRAAEDIEVFDVAAVIRETRKIRARVHVIASGHRAELLDRLERGIKSGKIDPEQGAIETVRRIIAADNIIMAKDNLGRLETGMKLPETEHANIRLAEMLPAVTDFAAATADVVRRAVEHADRGVDFEPLKYSKIATGRHANAAAFLRSWLAIGEALEVAGDKGVGVAALPVDAAIAMLRELGVRNRSHDKAVDNRLAGGKRHVTFEMTGVVIPFDPDEPDSRVLPDFGSSTGGWWKVMVCSKLPESHVISGFAGGDDVAGRLVIVTEPVSTRERRVLAKECSANARRVLVVDAAIALAVSAETELRPATMIELAQPFSYSDPYNDFKKAAVPVELFVGRNVELIDIMEPHGTNIVYGGRRLGKTALLRHIANTRHNPEKGVVAVHIDIQLIEIDEIWRRASEAMRDVFPVPVGTADEFKSRIFAWLATHPTSRILLMIDEADRFIEADARIGHRNVDTFIRLMGDTSHRFKFVFAGLHCLTRLATGANSPLMQVSSNPVCIGPLDSNYELAAAERLLTKPLSAMGFEFESRDLVWQILAEASYIPVTVQLIARRFLRILRQRPFDLRSAPPTIIDESMVKEALEDREVQQAITHAFNMTLDNDPRYKLIANIIGQADIVNAEYGHIHVNGLTTVEVWDKASEHWPSQFSGLDSLSQTENMLEEMEGLGLLRRETRDNREGWTLRSSQIGILLGTKEQIENKLLSFVGTQMPKLHDIRELRRHLRDDVENPPPSPLTSKQEQMLLGRRSVIMLVGSIASGIHDVADGIRRALKDQSKTELVMADDSLDALYKQLRDRAAEKDGDYILLFDEKSRWTGEHLNRAIAATRKYPGLEDGKTRVRAVFLAGPDKWFNLAVRGEGGFEKIGKANTLPVTRSLRCWNDEVTESLGIHSKVALLSDERRLFLETTGGFNTLGFDAMQYIAGSSDRLAALERWFADRSAQPDFLPSLGIVDSEVRYASGGATATSTFRNLYAELLKWQNSGNIHTVKDIREALFPDDRAAGHRFAVYAAHLGLLASGDGEGGIEFNPITPRLHRLLNGEASS